MITPWSQFFRDILPETPGCPDPVIEHALLRAAQEFFERTALWTVWLDNVRTIPSVQDYDIELEPNSELVRLVRATLDGRDIDITTPEALPSDWQTYQGAGLSECIFTRDLFTITVLPRASRALLLRVEAVLKPSDKATGIEDYLFRRFNEAIANGAKGRLLLMANKPWTSQNEGLRFEGLFKSEMRSLHFRRMRAFSSARPRRPVQTF
jgi:hypothetical protein